MPFHLAAFFVAIGQTVDTDVPALNDQILPINNNHFVMPRDMPLLAAAAMSTTLNRVKFNSPSMRQIAGPFVRPDIVGNVPPTNPNVQIFAPNTFRVPRGEELQVAGTSDLGAGTEHLTVLVWMDYGFVAVPVGNITPLRFTSTTAAVINTWTDLTLTFADSVPAGTYAAVFSEHFSTTGRAHRWIFSNQVPRPGFFSFATHGLRNPYEFQEGRFGMMGRFITTDFPRLQVLAGAADASHIGYLHVVKISNDLLSQQSA